MFKMTGLVWEIIRKLVHLSGLFIIIFYTLLIHVFSEQIALLAITGLLLLLLEIEYIRIEHQPKIVNFVKSIFRDHEEDHVAGSVFFVISCIICFAAFDYWIAVLAMFMTIFGDLVSALVGKSFGVTKIYRNKSVAGTFSGLGANLIVGALTLPYLYMIFIPMAFVASFVEMITGKLDDNLTVPLFAGFTGQMLIWIFNISLPAPEFSILGFF
ncbi:hypothetical protein GF354_06750 [Candidatus Peregrinibacteria bacterium]|nr:hypothetical protein [Candidatus Peregrinibacteria bacterium]